MGLPTMALQVNFEGMATRQFNVFRNDVTFAAH